MTARPFKRAGHLVADHPGAGPRILLIGHLDTVFEKDSPFQKFERVDDRTARGPGIIDMKGGDVVMIGALKALQSAGVLKTMNVVVVMTGDEEDSGRAVERGARSAGRLPGSAPISRLASRTVRPIRRLAVTARRGHDRMGSPRDRHAGALLADLPRRHRLRRRLRDGADSQRVPGEDGRRGAPDLQSRRAARRHDAWSSIPCKLRGSAFGKTNVVAEHAVVSGDLRALSREQFENAKKTMTEIVGASLPHTSATITFDEGYPPMAPTDGNAKLLAMYDQASRDLGLGTVTAVSPDRAGAADVSFVAGDVKMILDGVGLMGHDDHTANETADLTHAAVADQANGRAAVSNCEEWRAEIVPAREPRTANNEPRFIAYQRRSFRPSSPLALR